MYDITIPRSLWFEVQQYLAHNYYCQGQDYRFFHRDYTVELSCVHSDLHDRILKRFAGKL